MTVDNYVAIFRSYQDFTIFVIGHNDDNELILATLLDCIHECFDRIFASAIERKSLIDNMSGVILVIDELIDQGVIMHTDPNVILSRIRTSQGTKLGAALSSIGSQGAKPEANESSGGLFASVFSSAKSQLAKSMGM